MLPFIFNREGLPAAVFAILISIGIYCQHFLLIFDIIFNYRVNVTIMHFPQAAKLKAIPCVHGCSEKRSDGLNHNVSDFRADRKRLLLHSSYSNCGYLPKMKLKMALVRTSDSAEKVIGVTWWARSSRFSILADRCREKMDKSISKLKLMDQWLTEIDLKVKMHHAQASTAELARSFQRGPVENFVRAHFPEDVEIEKTGGGRPCPIPGNPSSPEWKKKSRKLYFGVTYHPSIQAKSQDPRISLH
ncbi:hypothetical protein SAY87_024357 [Trapa incisa]|uniref:Uncharacterized protein n=1 Tax=Trapa incisa TaxID=236973 RepID=A0AAN7JF33_9MYRT|nr:hypothetical protein SAY87_024357 [Trapa incisa]